MIILVDFPALQFLEYLLNRFEHENHPPKYRAIKCLLHNGKIWREEIWREQVSLQISTQSVQKIYTDVQ